MQMTRPSGRVVDYSRDGVRRIAAIDTTVNGAPQTLLSAIQYRGDDQLLSRTLGNGLIDARTYDLQGRLLSQQLRDAGGFILDERTYSYDKNNNILNIDTNYEQNQYAYDKLDRLINDTVATAPITDYTYDLNDNRLTRQAALDAAASQTLDELIEHATGTNRIQIQDALSTSPTPLAPIPNRDLIYNDAGRLRQLFEEGLLKAEYLYNDAGQRTRKTVYQSDGITVAGATIYHYDSMSYLITETDAQGNLIKDYLWLEGMTPVAQIDNTQGTENVLYLTPDHLMTHRLATDATQAIVWRWEGEAFGNTPPEELAGYSINLRFPGQYYDQETGLHYNMFRYFDPNLGRYITSDGIGLRGGLNTYLYANANPLRYTDSTGELVVILPFIPPALAALGKALAFVGSTALAGYALNEIVSDDDDVIPFPDDKVKDKDKTGLSDVPIPVPVPDKVKQICPLIAETAYSCFYICPDNSEIFLIKGVDSQCGDGDKCPPVQVK